jgi:hypothetical protein
MLNNYEKKENGVIKQSVINNKIDYNVEYVTNSYDNYGEKVNYISYLRLGYLLGAINEIPNSILDVGYGNGSFLKACKDTIKKCYGNDVSNYNLPDGVHFVNDIFSDYYDVITFFDSLEHFQDIDFVKNLKCKYILISVPWCHYHSDIWFENWKHRRPDEHIYHFNDKSLNNFMMGCGFENMNISCVEDTIRRSEQEKNILTGVFKKI